MALDVAVGSFNIGTAAAGNTTSVTGLPFQPKVVIFFWNTLQSATDAVGAGDFDRGFGWMVSATERHCVTSQSEDASAKADCDRVLYDNACIASITVNGITNGKADFDAFLSDGFRVIIDDAFALDHRVGYLAIGGADLTNVKAGLFDSITTATTQDVTDPGFEPGAVFLISRGGASGTQNVIATSALTTIGCAAGATPLNAVLSASSTQAADPMDTNAYCRSGECFALAGAGVAVTGRASVTAWLSNGFTLSFSEATGLATPIAYLALKGPQFVLGNLLTQTDTTTAIEESFGFTPKGVLLMSACRAEDSADAATAHDRWTCGAFTGTGARVALGGNDEDNVATSNCNLIIEHDACYANVSLAGAIEGLMDVQSIDTDDGFTLIMDDADPAQHFAWYLAMGDAASVQVPTPAGSLSLAGRAASLAFGMLATVGSLAFTGYAPTVDIQGVPPVSITIPAGSLALTGRDVGVAFLGPDIGRIAFSGYAPTVTSSQIIQVPVGSIVWTSETPELRETFVRDLPAGALTFAGSAPNLGYVAGIPAGAAVFSGAAPQIALSVAVPSGAVTFAGGASVIDTGIALPAGALTLTGQAPTAFVQAEGLIEIPAGALTLEGRDVGIAFLGPDVGQLTLAGYAPTVVAVGGATTIHVPAGTLAFTGLGPAIGGGILIAVPSGSLVFSGQYFGIAFIDAGPGQLVFTGYAPTAAVGGPGAFSSIAFDPSIFHTADETTFAITISVPAGSLVLTGQAPQPQFQFVFAIPAGTLELVGRTPALVGEGAITLPTGSLIFGGQAPSLRLDLTVAIPAGGVTWSGVAPVPGEGFRLSVSAGAITLTGQAPAVRFDFQIPVPSGALTFSGRGISLVGEGAIAIESGTLALSGRAPTIRLSVALQVGTLTLSGQVPVSSIGVGRPVPAGALTFTGRVPALFGEGAIAIDAGALSFAGQAPNVQLFLKIQIPAGSLVTTGQTPVETIGQPIALPAGAVVLSGSPPTLARGLALPAGTLVFTGTLPEPLFGAARIDTGQLVWTGYAPSALARRVSVLDLSAVWMGTRDLDAAVVEAFELDAVAVVQIDVDAAAE